jgi:glutamate dehydrogenase/leucine dehydrogenase
MGDATLVHYVDQVEGFEGFLVIDGRRHSLAAGGLRLQQGLGAASLRQLAEAMSRKQRLLGLAVDGAKAGIDYDPRNPGKVAAIGRFLGFLRPYLLDRVSLGPDMGSTWVEIESAARAVGLFSVKSAVGRAQDLAEADFRRRLTLLDIDVRGLSLAQRRAGHAVAHASLAALPDAARSVRIGIQGFGTLGRATALSLVEMGLAPIAVADEASCLVSSDGLDVATMLASPQNVPIGDQPPLGARVLPREQLLALPLDLLVLAAHENAISMYDAARLHVGAIVVGANLGLAPHVEQALYHRGLVVVPDFVGGCGGSASMDALFGPVNCPGADDVLQHLQARMQALVREVLELSCRQEVSPREAALALSQDDVQPGRPYGRWDGASQPKLATSPRVAR